MSTETMTLEQVRRRGLGALKRELGTVGMIRFLQHFEVGRGDYTKERGNLLDGLDLDDIMTEIRREREG